MQIIEIEDPEKCGVAICENCNELKPCRKVEAFGMVRESRGYFRFCFDCFGPRMFWRDNGRKIWSTPVQFKDSK